MILRRLLPLYFLGLLLVTSGRAFAALEDYIGQKVLWAQVQVEGYYPTSAEDLARLLEVRPAETLSPFLLQRNIDLLYQLGDVENIQVEVAEGIGGIGLTFHILPRPFLGELTFKGNSTLADSELRKLVGLRLGHGFQKQDLERARGAMRRQYVDEGYSKVKVKVSQEGDVQTEPVRVSFKIEEGQADRVAAIRFMGVDKIEARQLSDVVRLRVGQRYVPDDAEADRRRLVDYYREQGRLAVRVNVEAQTFDNGRRVLRYTIDRGPLVELTFYQLGVPSFGPLRGFIYREVVEALGTDRRKLRRGSRDDAVTQLDLENEKQFSSGFVEEARIILEDYYHKKGYNEVRVRVRRLAPGEEVGGTPGRVRKLARRVLQAETEVVRFVITIRLGEQIPIHEVHLEGGREVDPVTFRELVEEAMSELAPWGIFTEQAFLAAQEGVLNYYRALGLLEAHFRDVHSEIETGPFGKRAILTFDIDEGPRTVIESVGFVGATVFSTEELRARVPLKEGEPFNAAQSRAGQEALNHLYRDHGYMDVEVGEGKIERVEGGIRVSYPIIEGQPHTFGEVVVQGLRKTRPRVIEREMDITPGLPYDPAVVTRMEADIMSTAVFRSVEIQPLEGGDTQDDLVVSVTEKVSKEAAVAVGLSFEDWIELSVELANNNAFGLGHRLSLRAEVAGMSQSLTRRLLSPTGDDYLQQVYATVAASTGSKLELQYQQPWWLGLKLDSVYNLSVFERDFKLNYRIYRDSAAWGLKRNITEDLQAYSHLQVEHRRPYDPLEIRSGSLFDIWSVDTQPRLGTSESMGVLYTNRFSIDGEKIPRSLLATAQVELFQMYSCDVLEGENNPWATGLSGCPGEVNPAENYAKASGRATWSEPWLPLLHTELRLQGGYAYPFAGSNGAIPVEKRFYVGGATSVRGFQNDALGPVVVDRAAFTGLSGFYQTIPTGGNAYFAWNAEATVPLDPLGDTWAGWEVALFQDGGNVWWTGQSKEVFLAAVEDAWEAGDGPTQPADVCDPLGPPVRTSYGLGLRYQTPVGPIRFDFARNTQPRCAEPGWRLHFSVGLF